VPRAFGLSLGKLTVDVAFGAEGGAMFRSHLTDDKG